MWEFLMKLGNLMGCHQKPERSFFIFGRQFPVCARCTGLIVGYIAAYFGFMFYEIAVWKCILLMSVMVLDWFLQYKEILMSSNFRRFITGCMCGYGFFCLGCQILLMMR